MSWLTRLLGIARDGKPSEAGEPGLRSEAAALQSCWRRGALYELFSVGPDASRLAVARSYQALQRRHRGNLAIEKTTNEAFTILSVTERYELYQLAVQLMRRIQAALGEDKYKAREARIWASVWKEVNDSFPLAPSRLRLDHAWQTQLVNKHSR